MAVYSSHTVEVSKLRRLWVNMQDQINCALDTGDRRAFRIWCNRLNTVNARIAGVLEKIVTARDAS